MADGWIEIDFTCFELEFVGENGRLADEEWCEKDYLELEQWKIESTLYCLLVYDILWLCGYWSLATGRRWHVKLQVGWVKKMDSEGSIPQPFWIFLVWSGKSWWFMFTYGYIWHIRNRGRPLVSENLGKSRMPALHPYFECSWFMVHKKAACGPPGMQGGQVGCAKQWKLSFRLAVFDNIEDLYCPIV